MWKVSIYMGSDRLPALGSGARGEKKPKKTKKQRVDCQSSFLPCKNQGGTWIIAAWWPVAGFGQIFWKQSYFKYQALSLS